MHLYNIVVLTACFYPPAQYNYFQHLTMKEARNIVPGGSFDFTILNHKYKKLRSALLQEFKTFADGIIAFYNNEEIGGDEVAENARLGSYYFSFISLYA